MSDRFHWARLLAYVTGHVNQELLLRNEYLVAENRILRAHLPARLRLSDPERSTLAEIAKRLGRKALNDIAHVAKPDTLLAWYRRLVAQKFDGSEHLPIPAARGSHRRWRRSWSVSHARTGAGDMTESSARWGIWGMPSRIEPWATESVRTGGHGNSTRLRALGGSSTVITRPETSIRELVLGQQNVVCTEPVS